MSRFQKWLLRYLSEHGLTKIAFAERTGVPQSLITHYANGTREPSYQTLRKIRQSLGVDMNELV